MPEPRPADELEMTKPARSAAPVWAPNPGVPVIARVLAYIFGGLMLLTIIISIYNFFFRSPIPDIPPNPARWQTFSADGVQIPYPESWYVSLSAETDGDVTVQVIYFSLLDTPNDRIKEDYNFKVRIKMKLFEVSGEVSSLAVDVIDSDNEIKLSRQYQEFRVVSDGKSLSGKGKVYTYLIPGVDMPMYGEWILIPKGRRILCLYANAPEAARQTMQEILYHMAENASIS